MRMPRRQVAVQVVGALAFLLILYSSVLSSRPLEGTIQDSKTHLPVAGVQVLALWQVDKLLLMGSAPVQTVYAVSAVTDEAGRFRLDGWNRLRRPWRPLDPSSPLVHVFHPAYVPERLATFTSGQLVELRHVETEMRQQVLDAYAQELWRDLSVGGSKSCWWDRASAMLTSISQRLAESPGNVRHPFSLLALRTSIDECGQNGSFDWSLIK